MSDHTPGPWQVETCHGDVFIESEGVTIAEVETWAIGCMHNARLLAAAPQMLEALRSIRSDMILELGNLAWRANFQMVDEAIKAATGEEA